MDIRRVMKERIILFDGAMGTMLQKAGIGLGELPESWNLLHPDTVIQIHKDALDENDVVLIHDDILATGGSMAAAIELVKKLGVKKIYVNCLIELEGLPGRKVLSEAGAEVDCLMGIEVDE